jgi:hypothetical protein
MAEDAGVGEEDLLSGHGLRVRGSNRALRLGGHPVIEVPSATRQPGRTTCGRV